MSPSTVDYLLDHQLQLQRRLEGERAEKDLLALAVRDAMDRIDPDDPFIEDCRVLLLAVSDGE